MKPSTEWWRYLAPLAVIAIIALIPVPAGLESHTALLCRFYWRDRWTDPRTRAGCRGGDGGYLHHRHTLSTAAVQPRTARPASFKFTAKSLSWAVSGFSNSVIWLIFAAFMFGTGYEKPGWDAALR